MPRLVRAAMPSNPASPSAAVRAALPPGSGARRGVAIAGVDLGALQPRVPQLRHALRADLGARPRPRPLARLRGHARADAASACRGGRRARLAVRDRRRLHRRCSRSRCCRSARSSGASSGSARLRSPGRSALLAAFVVATRVPFLSQGVRAYVDIPFLALVVLAAVLEVRASAPRLAGARPAGARRAAAAGGLAARGRLLGLSALRRSTAARRLGALALVAAAPLSGRSATWSSPATRSTR